MVSRNVLRRNDPTEQPELPDLSDLSDRPDLPRRQPDGAGGAIAAAAFTDDGPGWARPLILSKDSGGKHRQPPAEPGPTAAPPVDAGLPVDATPHDDHALPVSRTPGAQTPPVTRTPGAQTPPVTRTPGAQTPPVTRTPGAQTPPVTRTPGAQTPPVTRTARAETPPPSAPRYVERRTARTNHISPANYPGSLFYEEPDPEPPTRPGPTADFQAFGASPDPEPPTPSESRTPPAPPIEPPGPIEPLPPTIDEPLPVTTTTTEPKISTEPKENIRMTGYQETVSRALNIEGALGFAIVDAKSGMAMATGGDPGFDLNVAAAGNSSVVQAKLRTMDDLGLHESIEDILITLGKQFHLIRLTEFDPNVFLYLVLSRSRGNLAMARYQLNKLESSLRL
ncbi:hypothetical protein [Skermania piniformis]|nr:hypothetical protein [Skermania piniformis]